MVMTRFICEILCYTEYEYKHMHVQKVIDIFQVLPSDGYSAAL